MRKNVGYKRPLAVIRSNLATFNGVSDKYYSTNVPIDVGTEQLNLCELNGQLTDSAGLVETEIPYVDLTFFNPFNCVTAHYPKGMEDTDYPTILLANGDGIVWYRHTDSGIPSFHEKQYPIYSAVSAAFEVDGVRYTLLAGAKDNLVSFDGEKFVSHDVGHSFYSLVNHYGRLFACKKDEARLYFSAMLDPYNWNVSIDEGGYINLPGENGAITQLISFGEILAVVQERGLSKVTAFNEQSDFIVKYINIENDIMPGSAVNCMDKIVYCSSTGIGIFDGYESRIFFRELSCRLTGKTVSGAYAEGKCYFSLTDSSADNMHTEILVIDLTSMKYHFISNSFGDRLVMVRVGGKKHILCYYGDSRLEAERENAIAYLSENNCAALKVWRSGKVDFGRSDIDKLVRRIVFGGNAILSLSVVCDNKDYVYKIDEDRRVLLNLRGRNFVFEISVDGNGVSVPPPVIEYQLLEGV